MAIQTIAAAATAVGGAAALGHDFSLFGMFLQASPAVQAIMVGLALASVWSWALIIEKAISIGRLKTKARKFEDAFWSGNSLDDLHGRTEGRADHPMAKVFVAGMNEFKRGATPTGGLAPEGQDRIDKVMRVAVDRELERCERGLPVLASIGSAAPFVGLLGTVLGIMAAFQGIGATGDASLATVAPGIAEALFATAIGLIAAIPAVIGYNRHAAALSGYAVRLEGFAGEFSALLGRQQGRA